MSDKLKTVREALEQFRPCDHLEYEDCGSAGLWRTCSACGIQFATDRHESIKKRARMFDEALAALSSMEAEAGEVVAWMTPEVGDPGRMVQVCTSWQRSNGTGWEDFTIPLVRKYGSHPKAQEEEVELTWDEFELQNLMNRCSREHSAKDDADELSRETMAVFVTWLRDHGHLAPFAPPVELTEYEVERMTVADNVDPEQWSYLETIGQRGTYLDGMALGIRHLASKYRLIPRKP